MIKKYFNEDLPISGGIGNSMSDAVIIELEKTSEGIQLEYIVAQYILALAEIEADFIKQELHRIAEKRYDKLIYKIKSEKGRGTELGLYFDITKFFGKF
ncbi:MAG: hypothetical protein LWX07_13065 [Bacteroidetes bacterium]|nr:hypothetical protein [Bacteroidota bacterium]